MQDFTYCVPGIILGTKYEYSEQKKKKTANGYCEQKRGKSIPNRKSLNAHLHVFPNLRLLQYGLSKNHILFFQIVGLYVFMNLLVDECLSPH